MTNNELLNASLLDILFDGRNKEYGAYALRRGYDRRMLLALGIGMSIVLLMVLISGNSNRRPMSLPFIDKKKDSVVIRPYTIPMPPKPPEVLQPVVPPAAPAKPLASIQFPPIKIVRDDLADKEPVPTQDDITEKQIDLKSGEGEPFINQVISSTPPGTGGSGTDSSAIKESPGFLPEQANPEFPGGQTALMKFLSRNLQTPDQLELGEIKMVKARFVVNKDGTVSLVEIESSGGQQFDKEVIRVCKKMPKWKPAVQNGHPVAVSYVLPVTFMSVEQ